MCSVSDADSDASEFMEGKPANVAWNLVCTKCSEVKPVVQLMQVKHAYCRQCLLSHVNHKFRATLGKSKMMRPSDVVLASFSGSRKSLALLHLLQAEKSFKRFLFKVHVLYIDEGAVMGIPLNERESNLMLIGKLVSSLGFSLYFTSLSYLFSTSRSLCYLWKEDSSLNIVEEAEKKLIDLMNSVISLTAKEDLLKLKRKSLMVHAAKEVGCGKIFLANTSTDLAIQILTDVSLGRGSQMHHDVSFCDDRLTAVKILRPMRELSSKEVAFYSVYNNLHGLHIPSLCSKTPVVSSIHRLSEQFVMDLMEGFPSTVSTIFRTGEKLGSSSSGCNDDEANNVCFLCQGSKDKSVTECSSVQATHFSRLISSLGSLGFDDVSLKPISDSVEMERSIIQSSSEPTSSCSASQVSCDQDVRTSHSISHLVCYGCHLILQDVKPTANIAEIMMKMVGEQHCFQEMRESIKDFLL